MSTRAVHWAHQMKNQMPAIHQNPVRATTKNSTIPRKTTIGLREPKRKRLRTDQKEIKIIKIGKFVRKLSRLKVNIGKTGTTRTKKRRNPKMSIPADRRNPITVRITPIQRMRKRTLIDLENREVKNPRVKTRRVKARGIKILRIETRRRVKVPKVKTRRRVKVPKVKTRKRVKVPRVKTRRIKRNSRTRRKMTFGRQARIKVNPFTMIWASRMKRTIKIKMTQITQIHQKVHGVRRQQARDMAW